MKKIALIIFLLPLQVLAVNWVYIGTNNNDTSYFIDASSIQRNNHEVTYWEKTNYSVKSAEGILSIKSQSTINCKTREATLKYAIAYSELNNAGNILDSLKTPIQWRPIPPESMLDSERMFLCK